MVFFSRRREEIYFCEYLFDEECFTVTRRLAYGVTIVVDFDLYLTSFLLSMNHSRNSHVVMTTLHLNKNRKNTGFIMGHLSAGNTEPHARNEHSWD